MKRLALCGAVLALAGCGSSSGPQSEWAGPVTASADGTLPVSEFNDFLAGDGEQFAGSPVMAVAEFLRLDQVDAGKTSMVSSSPGEVRDQATVVATLEGLLDDSVRAARYDVALDQDPSGMWRLTSAKVSYQCQPGRGHADFSPQPCV